MRPGKIFYLEHLIPVKDYVVTLKKKEILFDWFLPLILTCTCYLICVKNIQFKDIIKFNGYAINSLAILIGFSITCLTILSTSGNERISELKSYPVDRKIGGQSINLYQLIFITFSFALMVEIILLLYNLIFFLIFVSLSSNISYRVFFLLNIFLLFHILMLNIRNITNFYFVFYKNNTK